ncbi:MAG TPA: hypothetical protein VGX70_18045 [Gemmataceae bacterium]|jgi:hypothetical protein|nr:hypothetical protein [Gemmataceae bacterium]
MKRTWFVLAGMMALTLTLAGFARQEADPQKEYNVTPEVGPWMICAASYMGDTAPKMAHDLVLELRRDPYDLPAFVFNRGAEERRKIQEDLENQRRRQQELLRQQGLNPDQPLPARRVRVQDQCAVLIGGYKDMETARAVLEKIKKLPNPKSVPVDKLMVAGTDSTNKIQNLQTQDANIFRSSFVTRNPTVPQEKVDRSIDPATLKHLNSDESYSLLKCKQPWTLAVKEFMGGMAIQPASAPPTLLEKLLGNKSEEHMSAIGKQAHEVAKLLREHLGFEAYVLHTPTSSVVTVGAYADPNADELHQAQQKLKNLQLGWIQLVSNPLPMPVPKP